ncbi:transketolase family protein [Aminobacter aganoensis]|uniref:Transketolase n=1 Tax=Aminobacter aganoensis TaxID=83264 RepID=A0A7X0F6B8_9HYPH|nr:transketolase C-terminal domain-containing protein [Aminobacter aganoensis]MBB6353768.1 transketolase [Aminobacter aganoensis]
MTSAKLVNDRIANPYGTAFLEYAGPRPDVVVLAGDTAGNNLSAFRDAHPERFLNIGMAEQNMIGVAGGMARGGLTPFVHTIATFLTRRTFDQMVMAIAYPKMRVRLIGGFAGLNFGGVSHQAIDDVALMRAIPGMVILDLADATEIRTMLPTLDPVDGPVYCRIPRPELLTTEVPVLFDTPFELGVARELSHGTDLALISSSITTSPAILAAQWLQNAGVGVHHLHISTVRPLDDVAVLDAVERTRATIVVENHLTTGGLGSAVAELMAERGSNRRLVRLGLRDTYARGGTEVYLLARQHMDAPAILKAAQGLLDLDPSILVNITELNPTTKSHSKGKPSYGII